MMEYEYTLYFRKARVIIDRAFLALDSELALSIFHRLPNP